MRQPEHRSAAELRDAIREGSRDVADFVELANLLKSEGRNDEAVEIYKEALRLPLEATQAARIGWELGELLEFLGDEGQRVAELAAQSVAKLDDNTADRETQLLLGLNYALLARARAAEGEQPDRTTLSRAASLLQKVSASAFSARRSGFCLAL